MKHHFRILALGAVLLVPLGLLVYLWTLLPLWLAETPLVVVIAYSLGKVAEIWARSP